MPPPPVFDSVVDAVGNTPMIRLNRVCDEYPVEFLAKCEFLNPGGSIKDRIGVRMLLEAERAGRIKPGDTLIEPTSGNTGIGIALAAAARGYNVIITMPMKMSTEKQVVLEALGARIVRTPTEAPHDSPESLFGVAERLLREIPNSFMLDQYKNPNNPDAHYFGTGAEIVEQCGGRLDYCVVSVGTGGAITGIARRLREEIPTCKIVGVDPVGSVLGGGEAGAPYLVEGIGYDFFPDVLDNSLVDEYVKTVDSDSFYWARRIIRDEGLLVGGSAGAVLWAARQIAARDCKGGERMVLVFADSVRNYLSKFLSDAWMREHGFPIPGDEAMALSDS